MKQTLTTILFSAVALSSAHADLPWWHQPTVCRLDTTKCYTSMGAGFDMELWDIDARCRGMKIICGNALTTPSDENITISKSEVASKKINSDFDINVLGIDGDCFGRRKTSKNGSMAIVNGKPVKVYCTGILDSKNVSDEIEFGEIAATTPTCQNMADNGYIAVLSNDCYGKYFDMAEYKIECGNAELPNRIIVLNDADYTDRVDNRTPQTQDAANDMFDTMYETSLAQQKQYFTN